MRQRRGAYAPEFRQQMVELVRVGRKPGELAKEVASGGCLNGFPRHRATPHTPHCGLPVTSFSPV